MICPDCRHRKDRVVESRESRDGEVIRRRRECLACGRRFTTYERAEEIPYMVIKKDGQRELFDRSKILSGVLKACEKRPVPGRDIETVVTQIEKTVVGRREGEVTTEHIGQVVMEKLKELDKVAYVRFASVYLEFRDVGEFRKEIERLFKPRSKKKRTKPEKK